MTLTISILKKFLAILLPIILLFLSSLFFSFINSIYFLAFGIFLMRFSGQGLMSHTSTTTISRFFERSRGKALSTIWFGLSFAEFILPVSLTYMLVIYSWRSIWQGIAILIILFLPFVILNTIKLTWEIQRSMIVFSKKT